MFDKQDDGPEIAPSVIYLFDLLDWVRKGRVRVPDFQRRYVWRRDQMLDLFDSVRRHYPIGSLLFWSTNYTIARSNLGPLRFEKPASPPTLLVLDGQQRLTTLAGVLMHEAGVNREEGPDAQQWKVYFDPLEGEDGAFTHLPPDTPPKPWQLPLQHLMSTRQFFNAVGELLGQADSFAGELTKPVGQLVELLQEVSRAFQSYKIPVIEFRTNDLSLAVESFARLNRKGVSIGADEMFSALTFAIGEEAEAFNVAKEIDKTLNAIQATEFGDVERMVVLRTFLVTAGLDPFRTDWTRLGKNTRARLTENLPTAMGKAHQGLLDAIAFLKKEHIYNERMLPYGLQLIGLAVWFAENPEPSDAALRLLRRWLWLTGFSSWFGQGNPSRYTRMLTELRSQAQFVQKGGPVPMSFEALPWATEATPFPARFDFRSARVRTLVCILAREGCLDVRDQRLESAELGEHILQLGPQSMRHIQFRAGIWTSSPANRMFNVFGEDLRGARTILQEPDVMSEISSAFCESHLLIQPLSEALRTAESMAGMFAARERKMMELERRFLSDLELTPTSSREPADSPIDREDEPEMDREPERDNPSVLSAE